MRRKITAETVVYSAAIWWRDCDPMYNVLATTAKRCEAEAMKAMRREARESYNLCEFDPGDKPSKKLYEYLDDLCWSGVCAFTLSDLATGRELQEVIDDLETSGVAYLSR